ncbi:unnamed protein product [Spodoptera littoralis]|uniref:Uncharacterized protein n=1 Tax=Spodoptera littoralis TaxID=7109 RepID=A0A9P0HZC6_SPOLI|nr:unnamed protein product [Spodoptera littoralis]CAH1637197.1 unnamed protein product [Spodoptera littoralis]
MESHDLYTNGFGCAGCVTVGLIGQPAPSSSPGTFTFSLNWAIAYELPNVTEATIYFLQKKYYKRQHLQKRINRRELYGKLETILDNMGYSGRECILKTLCETTQRLVPHGDNVVEEMFRTLFTMPPAKVLPTEPLEHAIYDAAHRLGRIVDSCDRFKCPISLVDLIKGYYNAPAPKCAGCMTVGVIGQPAPSSAPGTFTWGMNWGIAYELPNATETSKFYRRYNRLSKPMAQRRSRRELYQKLEKIMENMGYNGRQCILKTLCETTQRLVPHGENMVEEMFRTLFTFWLLSQWSKQLMMLPTDWAAYSPVVITSPALYPWSTW